MYTTVETESSFDCEFQIKKMCGHKITMYMLILIDPERLFNLIECFFGRDLLT